MQRRRATRAGCGAEPGSSSSDPAPHAAAAAHRDAAGAIDVGVAKVVGLKEATVNTFVDVARALVAVFYLGANASGGRRQGVGRAGSARCDSPHARQPAASGAALRCPAPCTSDSPCPRGRSHRRTARRQHAAREAHGRGRPAGARPLQPRSLAPGALPPPGSWQLPGPPLCRRHSCHNQFHMTPGTAWCIGACASGWRAAGQVTAGGGDGATAALPPPAPARATACLTKLHVPFLKMKPGLQAVQFRKSREQSAAAMAKRSWHGCGGWHLVCDSRVPGSTLCTACGRSPHAHRTAP